MMGHRVAAPRGCLSTAALIGHGLVGPLVAVL